MGQNVMKARRLVRVRRVVPGTSLLPIPFAIASAGLILFAATFALDDFAGTQWIAPHSWLSVGNIDDARAILQAILGAVSTVLALIFSVTLLVFSMAVSQFGPRLMPYFLRERTMQVALGLFLATFLQTLAAFVVTGRRGETVFVPQLTLLTSVVLVFLSFCYLVFYNHRIALAIQTNNLLARIVENLNGAIGELSEQRVVDGSAFRAPRPEQQASVDAVRQRCMAEGGAIKAITSGYFQKLDRKRIVRAAEKRAAIVCFAFRQGEYVLEGETLACVIPAACVNELATTIHHATKIGQHRTLEQDVEFAFAQLSEVAIRALSPAVNDTYTGLSSIDWLGDALRMLAALPAPDGAWHANLGAIRLVMPPLPFARIVRVAFDLIRQAGADNPAVIMRLLQTCSRLALQLHDSEQRRAIRDQVEAAYEAVARMPDVHLERNTIEEAYHLACDRLGADERPQRDRGTSPAPSATKEVVCDSEAINAIERAQVCA
jgi:uncharacterized membrane protein